MSLPKNQAWFPGKRYGYGWSFPRRWQGWVVVFIYAAALIGPSSSFGHGGLFITYACALSALLVAICIWKGEAPRWRWGKD